MFKQFFKFVMLAQIVNFGLCKVITLVNFTKSPQLRRKRIKSYFFFIFFIKFTKLGVSYLLTVYFILESVPSVECFIATRCGQMFCQQDCALHISKFIAPVSFETNLRFLGFWGYPEGGLYACFWMEMGNFVFKSEFFLKKCFTFYATFSRCVVSASWKHKQLWSCSIWVIFSHCFFINFNQPSPLYLQRFKIPF